MKILCAVDLSPQTIPTLKLAAAVAKRLGDRVEVLHVMPTPSFVAFGATDGAQPRGSAPYIETERSLLEMARIVGKEFGVAIEAQVLFGNPSYLIAEHARSIDAHMLLLGLDSGRARARWFLGSVAERTVRLTDRPVLVVPSHDGVLPASCLTPWLGDGEGASRRLRVLVGLDRTHASDGAITFVRTLRSRIDADVTFLHVYWPPEEYQRLGLVGRRDPLSPDPDVVASLEDQLRLRIGTLPGTGAADVMVRPGWGPTASNLLLGADLGEFNLIVVGLEHRQGLSRLWHGSVTEALVRTSTATPVVCVPRPVPTPARFIELPRFIKVLAPTDLSPTGNQAVPHAYSLLRGGGGTVVLCHVHERPAPRPTFAYDAPPSTLTPEERKVIEAQLRAIVPDQAAAAGITTELEIIEAETVHDGILQASERLDVDAINLGSHGRGEVSRAILGSVADKVVRHARRPVMVVRPDATRRP